MRASQFKYMDQFNDREPINNIWDREQYFQNVKESLGGDNYPEIAQTGRNLLKSEDPYQVKLGIHLLRLCLWQEPALAKEWVTELSQPLLTHDNPRVRHSALWNSRSSVWQDQSLVDKALSQAQTGLNDPDPAVGRVSIWVHGDVVINQPDLYEKAFTNIDQFLTTNPKESNYLFALEEFFIPTRHIHTPTDYFKQMKDANTGFPGVKARCANLLHEDFKISCQDKETMFARLKAQAQKLPEYELINEERFNQVEHTITDQFQVAQTFIDKMKKLWLIRELSWLNDSDEDRDFQILAESLLDNRDGDLIRTASVVLADNILKTPQRLFTQAKTAVSNFYEHSDIDGSQIVIGQTLTPFAKNTNLAPIIPNLQVHAANRSVNYLLNNL